MTSNREDAAQHIRNSLMLLGGLQRMIADTADSATHEMLALCQAISKRLWNALYELEPRRAHLVGK